MEEVSCAQQGTLRDNKKSHKLTDLIIKVLHKENWPMPSGRYFTFKLTKLKLTKFYSKGYKSRI